MTRKLLIASNILKAIVFVGFTIAELNCLLYEIEYRFQYLLILYFILPVIVILGILEYFGLVKIKLQRDLIVIFPFLTGLTIFFILLRYEGALTPTKLSWVMIFSYVIGIVFTIIANFKIIKVTKIKTE